MSNHIHPLVLATIEEHRARRELELERLRSARNACTTASTGGQSRAMALGKKIREVEAIVSGWRLAMATLSSPEWDGTCPYDCDHCHGEECPCPRAGCAGASGSATDMAALIKAAKGETDVPRVVAYRGHSEPVLHCVRCMNPAWQSWTPLVSEDLPDGGMCGFCHADVLA